MRTLTAICCTLLLASLPATAAPSFFEDFESGSDGWSTWPGALGQLNLDTSHNHTPGGQQSYRASEGEPGGFASYTQVADGTGMVRLDVWVYTDNANPDIDDSRGMIQLTSGVGFGTDYMQLGWLQDYPGGSERYSVRTRYRDTNALGYYDTGVNRPAVNDWVKLSIEADAGVGGDLRFYVNNALVYTGVGQRLGANLDTIRLGVNFGNNHDTVWYDDVRYVPEPAAAMMLGLGGLLLRRRRHA